MSDEIWNMDDSWVLKAIMENVADSIYIKDRHCRIVRASLKMAMTNGLTDPKEIIGKTDTDLYGEEFGHKTSVDDLHLMDTGKPLIGLVESHLLENGQVNWTSTTKLPLRNDNGEIIGLLGITREINDLKRTEQDLQHIATHDILTGLPNRYLFFNRLEHAISRAKRQNKSFAILYVDLDNFKTVNDRFGHDHGDHVLKEVAALLRISLRESDTIARFGGDEFVLLVEDIEDQIEPTQISQRILDNLTNDKSMNLKDVILGASIGISIYPDNGKEASTLINAADHAMYQAKEKRNSWKLFTFPKAPTEDSLKYD